MSINAKSDTHNVPSQLGVHGAHFMASGLPSSYVSISVPPDMSMWRSPATLLSAQDSAVAAVLEGWSTRSVDPDMDTKLRVVYLYMYVNLCFSLSLSLQLVAVYDGDVDM